MLLVTVLLTFILIDMYIHLFTRVTEKSTSVCSHFAASFDELSLFANLIVHTVSVLHVHQGGSVEKTKTSFNRKTNELISEGSLSPATRDLLATY